MQKKKIVHNIYFLFKVSSANDKKKTSGLIYCMSKDNQIRNPGRPKKKKPREIQLAVSANISTFFASVFINKPFIWWGEGPRAQNQLKEERFLK